MPTERMKSELASYWETQKARGTLQKALGKPIQRGHKLTRYPGYVPFLPHPNVRSWIGWYRILWGRLRPRCVRNLGWSPFWDAFWWGRD